MMKKLAITPEVASRVHDLVAQAEKSFPSLMEWAVSLPAGESMTVFDQALENVYDYLSDKHGDSHESNPHILFSPSHCTKWPPADDPRHLAGKALQSALDLVKAEIPNSEG